MSAVYNSVSGGILVGASEALVLLDASAAPWGVTFDDISQPVTSVVQAGDNLRVFTTTGAGGGTAIELSYAGGAFVEGAATGEPLEAVSDFPVTV